jgi:hypothetical protein
MFSAGHLSSFWSKSEMNTMIKGNQHVRAEDRVKSGLQDRGAAEPSRGIAPRSPSNWAWSTASSQYDWMDNHAPFAAIDWL